VAAEALDSLRDVVVGDRGLGKDSHDNRKTRRTGIEILGADGEK
jgi:hypothetical protein